MTQSRTRARIAMILIAFVALAAPWAWSEIRPQIVILKAKEQLANRNYQQARRTLESLLQKHRTGTVAQQAMLLAARAWPLRFVRCG